MKKEFKLHTKSILFLVVALIMFTFDHIGVKNIFSTKPVLAESIPNIDTSIEQIDNEFGFERVYVTRVIDGDTIELSDKRVVRFLGINTPENTSEKEVYGDIATNFVKELIEGKYVYLEKDNSDTDKYGRYIRNIWLEIPNTLNDTHIRKHCLNAILLLEGAAKPMTVEPNTKYSETYNTYAKEAQSNKKGMWNMSSNGTTKGDF